MGVYARDHAQQLILDLAGGHNEEDVTSPLSPRAQLLLLHIALKFGGDHDVNFRDVTKGQLWNRAATYNEGIGKKARAIGYNVPKLVDLHPNAPAEKRISVATSNRIKAAVNKAVKELLCYGLLEQTHRGQTGVTAIYRLKFLERPCSTCRVKNGMNETLHLPDKIREKEFEQIADSRGGGQDAWDAGYHPRINDGGW